LKLNVKEKFEWNQMFINEIKKKSTKKTIIKITGTKLDIKIQWKEMLKDGIE
jgi:hypothetical protein